MSAQTPMPAEARRQGNADTLYSADWFGQPEPAEVVSDEAASAEAAPSSWLRLSVIGVLIAAAIGVPALAFAVVLAGALLWFGLV